MLDLRSKDMTELNERVDFGVAWSSGDSIVNPKEIKRFSKQYKNKHICIDDYACHDLLRAQCSERVYKFIEDFVQS